MAIFNCLYCDKEFTGQNRKGDRARKFCRHQCSCDYRNKRSEVECRWCKKLFIKTQKDIKKTKNNFCSHSCCAFYVNSTKIGKRRSNVEIMLYNLIKNTFPNLNVLPNDKTMLSGLEIDIAIPELKLGMEWNGAVHFKPIYGQEKLDQIQDRDKRKLELANRLDINLIVVPDLISTEKYVRKCFEDIKIIINNLRVTSGS